MDLTAGVELNLYTLIQAKTGIMIEEMKRFLHPSSSSPTSPSSGQATLRSQLRHRRALACHSRAAFEGSGFQTDFCHFSPLVF